MHTMSQVILSSIVVAALLGATPNVLLAQPSQPGRDASQYNLSKARLAIDGYDPVAYFPDGGGAPAKGKDELSFTFNGATYHFASPANLQTFKANPSKYEPSHGGWCSYAMGNDGTKVEVDPKSFVVSDGRLFLFYKDFFNDTRKSFLKDQAHLTASADANWKKLSGEEPRTPRTEGLQKQLEELRKKLEESAPADRLKVYNEGIEKVAASGVIESALKVGASAPDFTLKDAKGASVTLGSLLKSGPVVLTWYRGGWCPYCNLQLHTYQEALPDIKAAGGQLVALSPELPDESVSTTEKQHLEFSVLSDAGNKVAHQYGVAYKLPDSLIEAFKGRLDIPKKNGDESWELPLAVTYVVGQDSKIVYAFVSADYRKRAEPSDVIQAVRKSSGKK
jgi:peroxiredoxin/YHS domain-containing protein